MTAVHLDERFVVRAPVGRVWDHLVDPRRVVACVPGGELSEVVDARTFDGKVHMRVGPFPLAFAGRVRLAHVDLAGRRVTIVGGAREGSGGSARLVLDSTVTPLAQGAEVLAQARLDVAGVAATLGRGFLEELGRLVFRDFAARVRTSVEAQSPLPAAPPLRPVPLVLRALGAWVVGWLRGPPTR